MIQIKRVYEPAGKRDGHRFLIERLWPRGIKKTDLPMEAWIKEAAPSTDLRKWFSHDPEKWKEFQRRYKEELRDRPEGWSELLKQARKGGVTLLFSSHDTEHNNAVVLKNFLEGKLRRAGK